MLKFQADDSSVPKVNLDFGEKEYIILIIIMQNMIFLSLKDVESQNQLQQ